MRPSTLRSLARPAPAVALLAVSLAARPAGAEPTSGPEARPGPFLAVSIGGGELGDVSPGLTGGELGLRGHLEVGYGDGRYVSAAISLALARSSYTNNVPPPEMILADSDLDVTRVGGGAVGEGRLPLGRLTPLIGAGVYLDRMHASASGTLIGIRGEYFEETDLALGLEARVGLDVRVHDAVQLGVRAGWSWSRADLAPLTDGAEWLSGPWVELRVAFDASGFRMASGSARMP